MKLVSAAPARRERSSMNRPTIHPLAQPCESVARADISVEHNPAAVLGVESVPSGYGDIVVTVFVRRPVQRDVLWEAVVDCECHCDVACGGVAFP